MFKTGVRFVTAFLATVLLDTVALAGFRVVGFDAAALFALGRSVFPLTARPLTDDFAVDRRTGVRDVERLNPFVMGLLI
ncbi:MAG: hypothetical protein ABJB97_03425 [Acidobacteriota bacterium]